MKNNNQKKWMRAAMLVTVLLVSGCSKDNTADTDTPKPDEEEPIKPMQVSIAGLDQKMEKFLTDNNFPGMSLAVSKNGKLVYQKGYGLADIESGEKVSTDSRFRTASVSKLFTSVAIMTLIQDGKLEMDQKVFGADGVLGTSYGMQPYKNYVTDVTISDLLHHTIGGWGQTNDPAFFEEGMDADAAINWTLDNIALTSAPGTSFAYSNFGYMLLSKIISKASGKAYEVYVKEAILNKVGATQTSIASTSLAGRKDKEVKYYGQDGDTDYVYDYINFSRADAAMGWLSTPKELLLFCNAVDGSSTRPDILNGTTLNTMTTITPASVGFGFHFGSGWVVEGDEWFWWGSLPGSFAILYRNANGICIAATANGRRQPTPENALNGFIGLINYMAVDATIPWQDIDQF
ncbi:MAG: class A beta-lactamase-related serine hydrolase [Sphingobacteriaceae bacterium]|nr:MAG: class A beta-lactamase-related serine hydrolase [Sphingobacteriaceae bacterium]